MNMKAMLLFLLILPTFVLTSLSTTADPGTGKEKGCVCNNCHTDYRALLPDRHPELEKSTRPSCLGCHAPADTGKATPNQFSALIHLGHQKSTVCQDCHAWQEGQTFDLPPPSAAPLGKPTGEDMEWIKKAFATWAGSPYLDAKHAAQAVTCAGCHGRNLPMMYATVTNDRCLACHGPMQNLVAKTRPAQFPDRNPHQSHLGDIACTVCHHSHMASEVYCLGCHANFNMTIR
jgi:hypothetical protein